MLFGRGTKQVMVAPDEALPGRAERPYDVPERHAVNGRSIFPPFPDGYEVAILGLGCFWGAERKFWQMPGVWVTAVGYAGGFTPNPTYEETCTARTGHAEVVLVVFDPEQLSYADLLIKFWEIHDPTTPNRQGNDIGTQYRSAIFHTSDEQKRVALDTIADVEASGLWPGKVVTEVTPASEFWEAEPEHQDYLQRYPTGYTCHFVRPGWKLPRRAAG
jgi:peptide-methionine (S)-S-oxide reductase